MVWGLAGAHLSTPSPTVSFKRTGIRVTDPQSSKRLKASKAVSPTILTPAESSMYIDNYDTGFQSQSQPRLMKAFKAVAKDRVSEVAQEAVTAPNLRLTQCYMDANTNGSGGYITLEVPLADVLALARQVLTTVPDDKAVAKRTVVNIRVPYT
ncbi:hypothetical protein B0A55_06269 [Friedmanniomyces simplex]|uniref:Uncharacterized protein n=1 Tax=Friedmanniomyces simplex TaxID=329884 RepID=A0A4U0XRL2_9PEZI|nr:hypothetical protein B0A55_06269 [Friedmanniomyces simplex]